MPDDVFARGGLDQAETPVDTDEASLFPSIEDVRVAASAAPDRGASSAAASGAEPSRLDLVLNIPVRLSVELGRAELPIREVVGIDRGSVIELDRSLGQPLDVRVNGVLIGHGEIVVIDEERLGLRFVDVVSPAERVIRLT
jgi:flagellar motor switch protein FliN